MVHDESIDVRVAPYGVRELAIGGVLDHTLYLLRDNWRLIAVPWLLFNVPLILLAVIVGSVMTRYDWLDLGNTAAPFYSMELNLLTSGHSALNFILSGPLTAGAVLYGLGLAYMGGKPTVRECIMAGFRKWAVLVVVYLTVFVVGAIGMMMCIIPGLLVHLFLFVAPPVAVLETGNPIEAMRRSAILMRGQLMPAFVLMLVVNFLALPFTSLLLMIPQFEISVLVTLFFSSAYPVLNLALTTVFYASSRCRLESLDLDLMASKVAGPVAAQEAVL